MTAIPKFDALGEGVAGTGGAVPAITQSDRRGTERKEKAYDDGE